jgi:hypothetical protein
MKKVLFILLTAMVLSAGVFAGGAKEKPLVTKAEAAVTFTEAGALTFTEAKVATGEATVGGSFVVTTGPGYIDIHFDHLWPVQSGGAFNRFFLTDTFKKYGVDPDKISKVEGYGYQSITANTPEGTGVNIPSVLHRGGFGPGAQEFSTDILLIYDVDEGKRTGNYSEVWITTNDARWLCHGYHDPVTNTILEGKVKGYFRIYFDPPAN